MPKNVGTPKHVGTWVFLIMGGELMKYGKNSDTEFPCDPDDKEAAEIAKNLIKGGIHEDDLLYIAHVFDNGQLKTFAFVYEHDA